MNDALEAIRAAIVASLPAGWQPYATGPLGVLVFVSALAILLIPIVDLPKKVLDLHDKVQQMRQPKPTDVVPNRRIKASGAAKAKPPLPGPPSPKIWMRQIALIAIVLLIAAPLMFAGLANYSSSPVLDSQGCRIGAPPSAALAIVVDPSTKLSALDRETLRQRVSNAARAQPQYAWLGVIAVSDFGSENKGLLFSACAPLPPRESNAMINTPRRVELRFQKQIETPLQEAVEGGAKAPLRPDSPIAETVATIASTPRFAAATGPKTIVVVSDGVQVSPAVNLLRSPLVQDWPFAERGLRGTNVILIRPGAKVDAELDQRVANFWTRFVVESGGSLKLVN